MFLWLKVSQMKTVKKQYVRLMWGTKQFTAFQPVLTKYYFRNNYLCQGGYVTVACVCLFIYLFVDKITLKVMKGDIFEIFW